MMPWSLKIVLFKIRAEKEKWEATEKEFLDLRIVFNLAPIQIEEYIRNIFFTLLASAG